MPIASRNPVFFHKPRTTLFLGSGFSVCAGLPTMTVFARAFEKTKHEWPDQKEYEWLGRIALDDYAAVAAIVNHAKEAAPANQASGANIEWMLAHLDMLETLWNETWTMARVFPEFVCADDSDLSVGRCREALSNALMRIYSVPTGEFDDSNPCVRLLKNLGPTTILTTNYDRVAESALDRIGTSWVHIGTNTHDSSSSVSIAKLHGDSGWQADGTKLWSINSKEDRQVASDLFSWAVPANILPTWVREQPDPGIRQIWREARLRITECERLIFVGVGLPQSDQHLAHLIAAGLMGTGDPNEGPGEILIINPDSSARNRVRNCVPNRLQGRIREHSQDLQAYVER